MPGWLSAAKNVLGRLAEPATQKYAVRCGCGRELSGLRGANAQTAICPACRAAVFVLPASPYPIPAGVDKVAAKPRQTVSEASAGARTAETSTPSSTATATRPALGQRKVRPTRSPSNVAAAASPASSQARPFVQLAPPRTRVKIITPVRLVLACILVVLGATAGWLYHLQKLAEAEEILRTAPRIAEELLSDGDLNEAANRFSTVLTALDTLKRDDPSANKLRQTAREISAAARTVSTALHEILGEAVAATSGGSRNSFSGTFRGLYQSDWVVFDAPVARLATAEAGRRWDVNFPIAAGRSQAVLVADFDFFEQLVPDDGRPHRVIFAAQLADFRPVEGDESAWQIVLDPSTAFLWSSSDNLERLGYTLDETTLRVLEGQTRYLGLEP